MLLFLEPMCLNLCLFSAIVLGILYLFFGAFNLVFTEIYGFNTWLVGMSFLGLLIGMLLAIGTDPIWHRNYNRLLKKHEARTGQQTSEPEYRLPPSIFGGWFCVIGLFWFAWTFDAIEIQQSLHLGDYSLFEHNLANEGNVLGKQRIHQCAKVTSAYRFEVGDLCVTSLGRFHDGKALS